MENIAPSPKEPHPLKYQVLYRLLDESTGWVRNMATADGLGPLQFFFGDATSMVLPRTGELVRFEDRHGWFKVKSVEHVISPALMTPEGFQSHRLQVLLVALPPEQAPRQ